MKCFVYIFVYNLVYVYNVQVGIVYTVHKYPSLAMDLAVCVIV